MMRQMSGFFYSFNTVFLRMNKEGWLKAKFVTMSNTLHYLLSTFQPCHVCGCLIALPYAKFMHMHISNVTCVCLFVFPVMNYVDGLIFTPLVIFSARKFPPRVFFFLSSKFVSLLCFSPVCAVQPHHTHTHTKTVYGFHFFVAVAKIGRLVV